MEHPHQLVLNRVGVEKSSAENAQKIHRAKMPCKRFSRTG